MTKQIESLTEPKKASNLALLSSQGRLALRETLTQTEAKEWIIRYKKKMREDGRKEAFYWWQVILEHIAKKRGQKAAEELRERMNALKEQND